MGISNLGNGNGYLYATDKDNTKIIAIALNNADGVRKMREIGTVVAPIAANRSAYSVIEVTAAAATGALSSITINAVNQIAANVNCVSAVLSVVAASWASAVNSFTPPSGYKYTALAVEEFIYLFAPPEAGATPNAYTPSISTTAPSLTATATQFSNGSSNTGVVDDNVGQLFFLDSDPAAIPNPNTFPLTFTEITKYMVTRGLQTGIVTEDRTIANDRLNTDRYCAIHKYVIDTESAAASDYLAFINPANFIAGDRIVLTIKNAARKVTVLSAPVASPSSSIPNPNIYLVDNAPYLMDNFTKSIELEFKYDTTLGGVFYEMGRSLPVSSTETGNITYFSQELGNDETGKINRSDLPFKTANAAINAVTNSGNILNTLIGLPGVYIVTSSAAFLATCRIHLSDGATLTLDTSAASPTLSSLSISGSGTLNWNKFVDVANFPELITLNITCKGWTTNTSTVNITGKLLNYNITANATMVWGGPFTLAANSGTDYAKITINAPVPDFPNGIFHTNSRTELFINSWADKVKGFVNITSTSGWLWNFKINGTLEWLINPTVPAVYVKGNAWFNNYNNFDGFFLTSINCSCSVPAIQLENARLFINYGIKHQLPSPADVPTIKLLNLTGASTLKIVTPGIYNFNSNGTSGIVHIDNISFAHILQAGGDFFNYTTSGAMFVATAAFNFLNKGVSGNVTILGTNVTKTDVYNTINAGLL